MTDFATASYHPNMCSKYLTIREDSQPDKVICGQNQRTQHIYTSQSNQIELKIANGLSGTHRNHFLLYYEGKCPIKQDIYLNI